MNKSSAILMIVLYGVLVVIPISYRLYHSLYSWLDFLSISIVIIGCIKPVKFLLGKQIK